MIDRLFIFGRVFSFFPNVDDASFVPFVISDDFHNKIQIHLNPLYRFSDSLQRSRDPFEHNFKLFVCHLARMIPQHAVVKESEKLDNEHNASSSKAEAEKIRPGKYCPAYVVTGIGRREKAGEIKT